MDRSVIILMVLGLCSFAGGAMVAATADRNIGIALMSAGLVFQVLTLRQLKQARKKETQDAR